MAYREIEVGPLRGHTMRRGASVGDIVNTSRRMGSAATVGVLRAVRELRRLKLALPVGAGLLAE